ncbi:MAG: RNA polymerase sigma factor [Thermoanaerobaculia bacterium]
MTADAVVIDEGSTREREAFLEIVHAAKAGDRAAFDEIMILTERRVAQLAWSILRDTEEVKEAIQETFLRVFRHLRRFDETKDFGGWLTGITVNVCRDRLRSHKGTFEPISEEAASTAIRADDDLIHRNEIAALHRAIDSLPTKERLAIVLHDVEGLPTHEVATALGNSVATVRVQLSRAREKLRLLLGGSR